MSGQDGSGDRAGTGAAGTVMLASDGDRDAVVRVLSEAFAVGRLTAGEHGERVRAAYAARTWRELARLTADLPDPEDARRPAAWLATGLPDPAGASGRPAARLTGGLSGPEDVTGRLVPGMPNGVDRCLLCALLICCPPAGIAWLLVAWRRSRGAQRGAVTAAAAPSWGLAGGPLRAGDGRRAEDR